MKDKKDFEETPLEKRFESPSQQNNNLINRYYATTAGQTGFKPAASASRILVNAYPSLAA